MGAVDDLLSLSRHRLTVDEYDRMAAVGLLTPDQRTELIDGEVIDVAPQRIRHAWVVDVLTATLHAAVQGAAHITCQTPVRLSDRSEPEPDLMLLRAPVQRYQRVRPSPSDVLLLVEVADTTARFDREIKLPLYAQHGIQHLWIIDLDAGLARFHHTPLNGQYLSVRATPEPGVTELPGLPGVHIDLTGILVKAA